MKPQKIVSARPLYYVLTAILVLFQTGCGTTHYNPERVAEQRISSAKEALIRSDSLAFVNTLQVILSDPARDALVKTNFGSSPLGKELITKEIKARIQSFRTPTEAHANKSLIEAFRRIDMLSPIVSSDLQESLSQFVALRNMDGTVPFTFADQPRTFSILSKPESDRAVYINTVLALKQSNTSQRRDSLIGLMEYALRTGAASTQSDQIKTILPSLNIRRDEIAIVRQIYPDFADARTKELTLNVSIAVKGTDRLVKDDIENMVKTNIPGLNVVDKGATAQLAITIERIRHDERKEPERKQTITYAQYEVDTVQAALLMPRNASYIYEIVSGANEIEYGYAIDSTPINGQKAENLIRGKVGGSYSRCLNGRIQNVFGGASSAGFQANDDMRRRCSGPSEISMDTLRGEVMTKIVDSIKAIPMVKSVYDLNR